MKTAVIYARFSSYNQQEQSIEGQLRACYEYAKRNDIQVIAEYCDRAKSGTNSNRPQLQKMLKDSELGQFQIVLVYQYDRFARNRRESINNEFILGANGVKLISINEPIDEEDSTAVIVKGMFESIAEYYSRDLSKKVKRGLRESIIKRQSIGGNRWLGYKTDSNMKIYIDDAEAETVKKIFSMRLSGTPVKEIVNYLKSRAIKNKTTDFNFQSVEKILKNEKYTGVYINPYDPTEVITDMYPQIIDRQTFDAVQDTFQYFKYNNCRGIKNPTNFHLSGKLFSAVDGSIFSGISGYSKTGKKYGYYKADVGEVTVKYRQQELEDAIIDTIKEIVSQDEYIDYLSSRMVQAAEERRRSNRPDSIIRRKIEINKRISKITDMYIDADPEMRPEINKKLIELREELNALDKELEYYNQEKLELFRNVHLVKAFVADLFKKDLENEENRKNFFNIFLNSVFVVDNHIEFYLNFDVEEKISFLKYKNDIQQLADVRLYSHMAVQERTHANILDIYFFRNTLYISIARMLKITKSPRK